MFGMIMSAVCAICLRRMFFRHSERYVRSESPEEVAEGEARAIAAARDVAAEEEAEARRGRREGRGGGAALARPAEPTLQAAPSALPVIAVIARRLPSAQATLISPEEAVMYETAAAEVTSNAV